MAVGYKGSSLEAHAVVNWVVGKNSRKHGEGGSSGDNGGDDDDGDLIDEMNESATATATATALRPTVSIAQFH